MKQGMCIANMCIWDCVFEIHAGLM